jgi:microcystin-dependent protein
MTKLSLAYNIANLTPADANPVEANYNRIEQHINQELIERDGSVAMQAELLLANDPTTPLGAATKQYVDQVLPIGMITPFGGTGSPPGGKWMACDGTELEAASFPALFAVIGTAYVVGTVTSGRFNLPDLRQRFPMGAGTTAIGSRGGTADAVVVDHTHAITHTHAAGTTGNDAPDHSHSGAAHSHSVNITTDTIGAHGHNIPNSASLVAAFGTGIAAGTGASSFQTYQHLDSGSHAHNVNGATGNTAASFGSGRSVVHQHPFQTPAFTGNSGAATNGASGTNANLPPYVALTWIIRVA